MYKGKKILAVITARGGSKGLPKKNIKPLLGKPLIAWTIEQAFASKYLDKVLVSTDDQGIADIARRYRAEAPFLRPKELATDTASSADVIIHALDFLSIHRQRYDYVALLEPTSPLRKKNDIDKGIRLLIEHPTADSLVSVGAVHLEHPMIIKRIIHGKVVPYADFPKIHQRQQADEAYFPYGVLYLSKTGSFCKNKTFYTNTTIPLKIERWQNYEIDDEIDFKVIEKLMREYR